MLLRVQLGVVALEYLRFRAHEVAHFERNASYIKPFFIESQKIFCADALHEIEVDCFCEDLSNIIFKHTERSHYGLLSEEAFLGMCYVLTKGILYTRGIQVGRSLRDEVQHVAEACSLPTELVSLFFRTISEEIWEVLD